MIDIQTLYNETQYYKRKRWKPVIEYSIDLKQFFEQYDGDFYGVPVVLNEGMQESGVRLLCIRELDVLERKKNASIYTDQTR